MWEETVLKDIRVEDIYYLWCGSGLTVDEVWEKQFKKQAEESYKAGVEAGTKRVIEQVDIHENELGFCEISNHIPYADWQAKLAEWGIK